MGVLDANISFLDKASTVSKVAEQFEDDDSDIFGFIPNPGNTVATLWGIPLGTQFGTAIFGEAETGAGVVGTLAVDILTDPTTWLAAIGGFFVGGPVGAAAGFAAGAAKVAATAGRVAGATAKLSKLAKSGRLLKGASSIEKMNEIAKVVKLAEVAQEAPGVANALVTAARLGDVENFGKAATGLRAVAKAKGVRFTQAGDAVMDVNKTLDPNLIDAIKQADTFGGVGRNLGDFTEDFVMKAIRSGRQGLFADFAVGVRETAEAVRRGERGLALSKIPFGTGTTQISKITVLNKAPVVKKAIEAVETATLVGREIIGTGLRGVGAKVGKGFSAVTGFDPNDIYKYRAVFSLTREAKTGKAVGEVAFMTNDDVLRISSAADPSAAVKALQFEEGIKMPSIAGKMFKPIETVLDQFGEAGIALSKKMNTVQKVSEDMHVADKIQLGNVFGMNRLFPDSLTRNFSDLYKNALRKSVGNREVGMLGAANEKEWSEQVRLLIAKLNDPEERWLHEIDPNKFGLSPLPNPGTEQAFQTVRKMLNGVANESEKANIQMMLGNGERIPFTARKGFMPHIFEGRALKDIRPTLLDEAARKKGFKNIDDATRKDAQASANIEKGVDDALVPLRDQARVQRFKSLESVRQFDIPGWKGDPLRETYGIRDAKEAVESLDTYFKRSRKRVSMVNQFGQENQKAFSLIDQIGGDVLRKFQASDPERAGQLALEAKTFANDSMNMFTGDHFLSRRRTFDVVNAINGVQLIDKLAVPFAALTNLGQSINPALKAGYYKTLKGNIKSLGEVFKQDLSKGERLATVMNVALREERALDSVMNKATDWWLDFSLFSAVERHNRRLSTFVGIDHTNELINIINGVETTTGRILRQKFGLGKGVTSKARSRATKELKEMGFTNEDIINLRGAGSLENLNPALRHAYEARAARSMVEATQFRTTPTKLPMMFSSPAGKFLLLFKSFAFKQQEFMGKSVVRPAVDFIATNGRKGDIKPMARLFATIGTGSLLGEVILNTKAALGARERPEDISERMVENFSQIGGFGMVMDAALSSAKFGEKGFTSALLGPNISSFSKAVGNLATKDFDENVDELIEFAVNPIGPVRGAIREEKKQRQKLKRRFSRRSRALQNEVFQMESFLK